MITYKHTCDKCRKMVETADYGPLPDWVEIAFDATVRYEKRSYRYELCTDCAKALGIYKDPTPIQKQSVGERLVEILSEIKQNEKD